MDTLISLELVAISFTKKDLILDFGELELEELVFRRCVFKNTFKNNIKKVKKIHVIECIGNLDILEGILKKSKEVEIDIKNLEGSYIKNNMEKGL